MTTKPERKSVQDMVYRQLRREIMELELKPGAIMSANDVSQRMTELLGISVSRTPAREAFLALSREGLVDIEPQRGTFVSFIDVDSVKQERFVRATLEIGNLKLFLSMAGPDDFNRLDDKMEEQFGALQRGDLPGSLALDNEFHRIFFEVTGNKLCGKILSEHNGHYDRVRLMTLWDTALTNTTFQQHRELMAYVRQREASMAEATLVRHLTKIHAEEIDLQNRYPEYFHRTEKR